MDENTPREGKQAVSTKDRFSDAALLLANGMKNPEGLLEMLIKRAI